MTGNFTIVSKMPSLNEVIGKNRTNRYAGAQMKKDIEAVVTASILRDKVPIFEEPVTIFMTFTEKTRKRDVDNIQSSQKFILDALVRSGRLNNDTQRWVKQIYHKVVNGTEDKVDVLITTDIYEFDYKGEPIWQKV